MQSLDDVLAELEGMLGREDRSGTPSLSPDTVTTVAVRDDCDCRLEKLEAAKHYRNLAKGAEAVSKMPEAERYHKIADQYESGECLCTDETRAMFREIARLSSR
jgi:hypothetical protein